MCYYVYQIKEMGWVGHVIRMTEIRNGPRTPVEKPEGRRLMILLKGILQEVGCRDVAQIHLAQGRVQ